MMVLPIFLFLSILDDQQALLQQNQGIEDGKIGLMNENCFYPLGPSLSLLGMAGHNIDDLIRKAGLGDQNGTGYGVPGTFALMALPVASLRISLDFQEFAHIVEESSGDQPVDVDVEGFARMALMNGLGQTECSFGDGDGVLDEIDSLGIRRRVKGIFSKSSGSQLPFSAAVIQMSTTFSRRAVSSIFSS